MPERKPPLERSLAEHRLAEIVEALRRINTGLELLHQQSERQIAQTASLGAKVEAALRYFIRAWQGRAGGTGP